MRINQLFSFGVCRSQNIDIKNWETVLPDALHSLRSLLCTAINATLHEWMFNYARCSSFASSISTWLKQPGPVLLCSFVRNSKYEPTVDEVELLDANPTYAHIRLPNGRESTVSVRDIAPIESSDIGIDSDSLHKENSVQQAQSEVNKQLVFEKTDGGH